MKNKRYNKKEFFRRALSMMLAIVVMSGSLDINGFAVLAAEEAALQENPAVMLQDTGAAAAQEGAAALQENAVPETAGETAGETTGETTGETAGETTGKTVGETTGEITGITTGETVGETAGETTGETARETTGEITGATAGETTGETTGEITGETAGETTGGTTGVTTGETTGEITGATAGETTGEITGETTGETTGEMTGETTGETTAQEDVWGEELIIGEVPADGAAGEAAADWAETDSSDAGEDNLLMTAAETAGNGTEVNFSGYQTGSLDIYNYLNYTDANGTVGLSSGGFVLSGSNEAQGIVIGNHPVETEGGAAEGTSPLEADIPVELNGLVMTQSVTVKPVGANSDKKAALTVGADSTVGALVLEENAQVELTLNADLTAGSIVLGKNSVLTVNGSGTLTAAGAFGGSGTIALNGGRIKAGGGISAENLSLNKTYVNAQNAEGNAKITAAETLSMTDSTVENASLFGYETAGGIKVLTLAGNNKFSNITAVGCAPESAVRVLVEGISTVTATALTTYYSDFTITWKSGEETLTPQADWPAAYRISSTAAGFSGANAKMQGYHTDKGYQPVTDQAAGIALPMDYVQPGYIHKGWKQEGSEDVITAVTAANGNLVLTAALEAEAVTVKLDRGYAPDMYTNDADENGAFPAQHSEISTKFAEKVTLPVPDRFGYKFTGWKIISGTNPREILWQDGQEMSYTAALEDYGDDAGGTGTVSMQALWTPDTFGVTVFLGSNVKEDANLLISVDGGQTFQTYTVLADGNDKVTAAERKIQFSSQISYGQNLSDFLRTIFTKLPEHTLPVLKDTSAAGTALTFSGWSNVSGAIDGNTCFLYGEGGMLTPGGKSLQEYQKDLHANNASVNASWGVMSYELSLPETMPEGWSLCYSDDSGAEHTILPGEAVGGGTSGTAAGVLKVPQNSTVTLITSAVTPQNFCLWGITAESGERIFPVEQPYHSGDAQLSYQFTMPAANVMASCKKGTHIPVDIARSPIEFAENITYNGRVVNGFWYADTIDEMTPLFKRDDKVLSGTNRQGNVLPAGAYFYQWYFSDDFYVTSAEKGAADGISTQNQITVVCNMNLHLTKCRMALRDVFKTDFSGETIPKTDNPDCVNIILDTTANNPLSSFQLFVDGENTLGMIAPKQRRAQSQTEDYVTICGETNNREANALTLGLAYGFVRYQFKNITLLEYEKSTCDYFVYSTIVYKFNNAVVRMPHKIVSQTKETLNEITKTDMWVKRIVSGYLLTISNSSYIHVYENMDIQCGFAVFASSLYVEGNMWRRAGNAYQSHVSSNSCVLIKGSCQVADLTVSSGVLIANLVGTSNAGASDTVVAGGKIITNLYSHTLPGHGGSTKGTEFANANGDNYPFGYTELKNDKSNTKNKTFRGGSMYIFSEYTIKQTADGPQIDEGEASRGETVQQIMNAFLEEAEDGSTDMKQQYRYGCSRGEPSEIAPEALFEKIKNAQVSSNAGFVMGRSDVSAKIIFSGVNLYVNGNIDCRMDTEISGGTLWCSGAISGKKNIRISGGNITAREIGNQRGLETAEDGVTHYMLTAISGGSLCVDRLGVSTVVSEEGTANHSTVTLTGDAEIKPFTKEAVTIVQDERMNYFLSGMSLKDGETNPEYLRFTGTLSSGAAKLTDVTDWKLCGDKTETPAQAAKKFFLPYDGGEAASWAVESENGPVTEQCRKNGELAEDYVLPVQKAGVLYAVKSSYPLTVSEGAQYLSSVAYPTAGGAVTETTIKNGDSYAVQVNGEEGGTVTLTMNNNAMMDKYVIWYYDGAGRLRNVMPVENGTTVSFSMPKAAAEIHIADELSLFLDKYEIVLTHDGFRTTWEETAGKDTSFAYAGDLLIRESVISTGADDPIKSENMATLSCSSGSMVSVQGTAGIDYAASNRIRVLSDFNNVGDGGRRVTLTSIYQKIDFAQHGNNIGMEIEENANVKINLKGIVSLDRVRGSKEVGEVIFSGENPDTTMLRKTSDDDYVYTLFQFSGADFTVENMNLRNRVGHQPDIDNSKGTVRVKNCTSTVRNSEQVYIRSASTLSIENCTMPIPIMHAVDLSVKDSDLRLSCGVVNPFQNIKQSVTLEGATTVEYKYNDTGGNSFYGSQSGLKITVKGKSKLITNKRLFLRGSLAVEEEGQIYVTENGYILCPDIVVDGENAKVNAGKIILSGYLNQNRNSAETLFANKGQFFDAAAKYDADTKNFQKEGALTVKSGTVTAAECIGGNGTATITVNGGKVETKQLGVLPKLYGFTVNMDAGTLLYEYERIPDTSCGSVSITGGEVNVDEYLGGMHSKVDIRGGRVNLSETAVLGLTDEQQTILYNDATSHQQTPENFGAVTISGGEVAGAANETTGKIAGGSVQVPYGTVSISGAETGVRVYNLMAYCGDMTISGAAGKKYGNSYTGDDRYNEHEKLAVYVENRLSAKNVTITDGSVVYAAYAYANVIKDHAGKLTVAVEESNRAYLYTTRAYGVIGEGEADYTYNDGTGVSAAEEKNVFGTKVVDVHYVIQPKDVFLSKDLGKEKNPNLENGTGLPYYVVSNIEGDSYTLQDASCSGYEFLGWYEYDPEKKEFVNENTRVYKIDKTNTKDVYLGAKWKKVKVTFEVRIELADESDANPETMTRVEGKLWKFNRTAAIDYGDQIRTEDGVLLAYYTTNTKGILEIAYGDTIIQKEDTVTAEMADAFVADRGTNPLVLMATPQGTQTEQVLITLDQNKNAAGRPEGTKFNLGTGEINSGSELTDSVSAYKAVTSNLGDMTQFAAAEADGEDGLIDPAAPGYTFGGWYTDKECTASCKVDRDTSIKALHDAKTMTLYAKWTPNTYQVQFSAQTGEGETNEDKRWVTADGAAPAADAQPKASLDCYWVYDTAPEDNAEPADADGDSFWTKQEDGAKKALNALPFAWREGYVFEGWQYTDAEGTAHKVTDKDELNRSIGKLLVENYVGSPAAGTGTAQPALTLYAVYRPVKVTYDLDGGSWNGSEPAANPAYGEALAGYQKESGIDGSLTEETDYNRLGTASGADAAAAAYSVVSTTGEYFKNHYTAENPEAGYVSCDYRKSLSRKGYTFAGWKQKAEEGEGGTADDKYYGCTPRFEDISLKAEWTPNVYNLLLKVKDDSYRNADNTDKYVSAFSSPSPDTATITGVTVGSAISAAGTWPDKTQWYAYNKQDTSASEDKKRFMLGATFAGLDPGDSDDTKAGSVYLRYADAVTNMLNSKTMFDNGDTFFLPEDENYRKDLAGADVTRTDAYCVPDYPTGSTIPMYGVYRERSLVFIEKYVDENGETQSQVMYSYPWSAYTDYPYDAADGYQKDADGHYSSLTKGGYALAGWFVGSETIDEARRYPKDEDSFNSKIKKWKEDTTISSGNDINVYTAYVAQQTIEQTLTANYSPLASAAQSSVSYTLPGSMQEGALSYTISGLSGGEGSTGSLKLVSIEEMQKHQYDSEWMAEDGTSCTADDTIAVELKLEKENPAVSYTADLTAGGKTPLADKQHIGKGWKLTLTLYHSRVMTQTKEYSFEIDYTFDKTEGGVNTLKDQWLKDKVTVRLVPSLYEVEYRAELPEAEARLTLIQPEAGEFEEITDAAEPQLFRRTVKQAYGTPLLTAEKTLALEGYERETSWSYVYGSSGTEEKAALERLTLETISTLTADAKEKELKDGALAVRVGYTAKTYKLATDGTIPADAWTITYGDGAGKEEPQTTLAITQQKAADVKYHSTVTFTPGLHQPAEYLTLTFTDSEGKTTGTKRLDEYAEAKESGGKTVYTFAMPAEHITVSYSNVLTLYLDDGTIELFPEGFRQTKEPGGAGADGIVSWPGDYRILQCEGDNADFHSTENVLILSGDLTKRQDGTDAERTISLGNLNITGQNSIELVNKEESGTAVTTKAVLTQGYRTADSGQTGEKILGGNIKAENILVPSGTDLTVKGAYDGTDPDKNRTIVLTPD